MLRESTLLRLAVAFATAGFVASSGSATAYNPWTVDDTLTGAQLAWRTGSASPPWNDATKTLTYRLNTLNFPAGNLPSVDQAGGALLNGFRSMEDLSGGAIHFRRGTNVSSLPVQGDGQVHVYFHTSNGLDPFGTDLSGAYAVTYPYFNTSTGTMDDAEIFFNAFVGDFTWSTVAPGAPINTSDIEVTLIHEALHAVGLLHPVYLAAAVWPVGRFPEEPLFDRIYAPDDRSGMRMIYPGASPLGRITGTVSVGAVAPDGAIVVATDADGIPQAAIHTRPNGAFDVSVPPGTYTVTAHHGSNSTYSAEISLSGPDRFISAPDVPGVVVTSGNVSPGVAIAAVAGTPTMKLVQQGPPGNLSSQVQFLLQGSSGTLRLAVQSSPASTFNAAAVASVDLGPGITATLGTVTALSASTTAVNVAYSVAANAVPGLRNVTLVRTSGERLFLPAIHGVISTGALSFAPGPANPAAGSLPTGAVDHPLLQVRLTAGAEDVRLRSLDFSLVSSGPAPLGFRLWRDVDADGVANPAVDERILPSAAYALPVPTDHIDPSPAFADLAVVVAAGTDVDLLLTMDADTFGSGTYTASLAAAGFSDQAHGMAWGDVLTPTGAASGGTQTLVDLAAGPLGQFVFPAGTTPVAVGDPTTQDTIVLRSVVGASSGFVGLDVEARPLGSAFTGTPTHSSPVTFAPGTDVAVDVGPLADGVSYHWRARPVSSVVGPGAWTAFGANAETERDFSRDTSTTTLLPPLGQRDAYGAAIPLGETGRFRVYLGAGGLNSAGLPVQIQVEVIPAGFAFGDSPTASSPFVASGSTSEALFTNAAAIDVRWQARAVSSAGSASAWTDFGGNGTLLDFHYEPAPLSVDDTDCSLAGTAGTPGLPWVLLALFLLAWRRAPATLPASPS